MLGLWALKGMVGHVAMNRCIFVTKWLAIREAQRKNNSKCYIFTVTVSSFVTKPQGGGAVYKNFSASEPPQVPPALEEEYDQHP